MSIIGGYESERVSVVIPTYERIEVLPRALVSAQAQTAPPGEIIVVDDGSTDGTTELVAREFPGVRVIRQSNRGVSAARNVGISRARGEWLAFLDSDDAWQPEKLEAQLAALAQAKQLRLCHTEEIWIRNGRRVNPMKKHAKSGGRLFARSLELCCISPSSAVLHRSVFDDYGVFDEDLPACEDYDLWLRVTAHEPTLFVDTPLTVKYGGHPDQLSRKFWGMDRFRTAAIEKILRTATLSPVDERAAMEMLVGKLGILVGGARKRGNQQIVEEYQPRLDYWTAELEALSP